MGRHQKTKSPSDMPPDDRSGERGRTDGSESQGESTLPGRQLYATLAGLLATPMAADAAVNDLSDDPTESLGSSVNFHANTRGVQKYGEVEYSGITN